MPSRTQPSAPAASAALRRLQRQLPELSVPALLRIRDAIGPALAADRVRAGDVTGVLAAAGDG